MNDSWNKKKSEYERIDSENMHADFIKNTSQNYKFNNQTILSTNKNYKWKWEF
jgi:hypothetical protein